jgi:hypothetical protein
MATFFKSKFAWDPVARGPFDGKWESLLHPDEAQCSAELRECWKRLSPTATSPHVDAGQTRGEESHARPGAAPESFTEASAGHWPKEESITLLGRFYRAAPVFARECESRVLQDDINTFLGCTGLPSTTRCTTCRFALGRRVPGLRRRRSCKAVKTFTRLYAPEKGESSTIGWPVPSTLRSMSRSVRQPSRRP